MGENRLWARGRANHGPIQAHKLLYPAGEPAGGGVIDFQKLWDFRDSFLATKRRGRDYISFYYAISAAIDFNINDLATLQSVLPMLHSSIDVINSGQAQDIVVDGPTASACLDMISLIRSRVAGDVELEAMLDKSESDVIAVTGLAKVDFLAWFASSPRKARYAKASF